MKSALYLALLIVSLTVWDSTVESKETDHKNSSENKETDPHSSSESKEKVRCDQLPKESLDPADLIRITSFTLTHAIGSSFNCSKINYIKPISPDVGFSSIVSQVNGVNYFDVRVKDCGKTTLVTRCASGVNITWQTYRARLERDTDGYFCSFICSSDGSSLERFYCVSAGNSVNPDIPNEVILDLKKKVPGAEAIIDVEANCPPPPFCSFLS